METEGVGYVFAAYGAAFGVLVAWLWIMAAKVKRLDTASRTDSDGAPSA